MSSPSSGVFCVLLLSVGPTQPTMVVLQALSEYLLKRTSDRDVSLQVDLKVPGRADLSYEFGPQTSYVARSSRVRADVEWHIT